MGQKAANTKLATTTKPLHGIQGEEHKKGKKQRQYSTPSSIVLSKALHGRLAGRCNDFAPSRQKSCHRQKQPSRPGPRKKKKNTAPSRPVKKKKKSHPVPPRKKKQPPRPASEKKKTPRPASKKKTPAPSRHEQQNTPPRGWKLETNTTACLFFSLSCCTFISYCSLVRSIF